MSDLAKAPSMDFKPSATADLQTAESSMPRCERIDQRFENYGEESTLTATLPRRL